MLSRFPLTHASATQPRPKEGLRAAIAPCGMGFSGMEGTKSCGLSAHLGFDGVDVDGNAIRLWLVPGFLQLESGRLRYT